MTPVHLPQAIAMKQNKVRQKKFNKFIVSVFINLLSFLVLLKFNLKIKGTQKTFTNKLRELLKQKFGEDHALQTISYYENEDETKVQEIKGIFNITNKFVFQKFIFLNFS